MKSILDIRPYKLIFLLALSVVHSDISPSPNGYYVSNILGVTQGPIFVKGRVQYSWEEDEEGYTVLPIVNRSYFYATTDDTTGTLIPTSLPIRKKVNGTLVGTSPATLGIPPHVKPSNEVQQQLCGEFCSSLTAGPVGRDLPNPVSSMGVLKNLIVLFKFSDHANRPVPSPSDISTLMNHRGDGVNIAYDPLAPTGSVRYVVYIFVA